MAAQPLPLGYCLDIGVDRKQPAPPSYPRVQGSWEQFGTAVAPARAKPELSHDPSSHQSVPTEVMIQSKINLATSFVRNSSAVLSEIDALAAGTEDEVRPTEYAYTRARSYVESAYGQAKVPGHLPEIVPQVSVTTDDVGGIRLAWRLGPKQLRANFGAAANLRSYLYFESALEHRAEDLDMQRLAGGLDWLTKK